MRLGDFIDLCVIQTKTAVRILRRVLFKSISKDTYFEYFSK